MEPILTIDNLNSFGGNMLRQGDKSQLKYRLRDVGNKNLNISGKSCEVKMYGRNYTTVVYETTTTVSSDNTVSFTINKVLPKGTFYLEFTVGDYIFPTDHREFFEITPSGKGTDVDVIEIVGKDVLIQAVKSQVDTELQPLVTSLESAQQAETQRASAESNRASAEEQREIDHANRSAELDSKADKVVIKNLFPIKSFTTTEYITDTGVIVDFEIGNMYYTSRTLEIVKGVSNGVSGRVTDLSGPHLILGDTMNSSVITYEPSSGDGKNRGINIYGTTLKDEFGESEVRYDNLTLIDLTETFGAGNEPTKEEMDKLINVIGHIDGTYRLDNKEMLGYLMKGIHEKADKKQEDLIAPSLMNGWVGIPSIRFYKDEFGVVHINGRIGHGASATNTVLFILPTGYRPSDTVYKEVATYSGANDVVTQILSIAPSGTVVVSFAMNTYCVINISFKV